jgi:hypothetical protein
MPAPGDQIGPLTAADLQSIWEGVADSGYVQPLEQAGDGAGLEVYTQMFQQFARASLAVDVTTQALYILPSSGQTNPSAAGASQAVVTLTFTRPASNGYIDWPIVLAAGSILVEEQTTDWGAGGGVTVQTGRQYVLLQNLVFPPGGAGPYSVQAQAVAPGYGYNNPLPGTLSYIPQPGSGYSNDQATMVVQAPSSTEGAGPIGTATLVTLNEPDMFQPGQVGQYVLMTAGQNAGALGRITGFVAPNPPAQGSGATLALERSVLLTSVSGTFLQGEALLFGSSPAVADGVCVGVQPGLSPGTQTLVFVFQRGSYSTLPGSVTGVVSGATAVVSQVLDSPLVGWRAGAPPVPATQGSGECWRVLDWVVDLGVEVTNAASPTGGKLAMLDELGDERATPRGRMQPDPVYAAKVAAVVDSVSPNAVRRALNRDLGMYGWCFREVGDPVYLPGFYYDRTNDAGGDFYDTHCLMLHAGVSPAPSLGDVVRHVDANGYFIGEYYWGFAFGNPVLVAKSMREPLRLTWETGDGLVNITQGETLSLTIPTLTTPDCYYGAREHVVLDYEHSRAYFQVGVPPLNISDFGFFFDGEPQLHMGGFWDMPGNFGFLDGESPGAEALRHQVYQDVDRIRAGGTEFDLYEERVGCP